MSSTEATNHNVDYIIKKGQVLWEQRTDSSALSQAEHFLTLAYEQRPENFELAILLGKINYTRAYFIEQYPINQDSLYLIGSMICRDAVINHPDFRPLYDKSEGDSTLKLMSAISNAPLTVIPGLYWWAVNYSRYLSRKPVLERLNHRELLEIIMNRILTIEPGFYFSGPYRFFGSLYARIPGIELSQSKTYFDQALAANPEYLGNAVLMAEFYHQKAGNREQFHSLLQMVVNTNLTDSPELITENYFYQNKAITLLENESSLFE